MSVYVLDRIEGSSLNLCSKILRDGSPLGRVFVPWYSLDHIEGFLGFVGSKFLQDGVTLLGSSLLLDSIAIEGFSCYELMAAYCSPSFIVQCWDTCAIYKSFRECLLKWNFHIKINFNILT